MWPMSMIKKKIRYIIEQYIIYKGNSWNSYKTRIRFSCLTVPKSIATPQQCTYLYHRGVFPFIQRCLSKSKLLKAEEMLYSCNTHSIMRTHSWLKQTNTNYKGSISFFFFNHHTSTKLDKHYKRYPDIPHSLRKWLNIKYLNKQQPQGRWE